MTDNETGGEEDTTGGSGKDEPAFDETHPEDSDGDESQPLPEDGTGDESQPPRYHPPSQERFDWRGWVLVAVLVVSFLVVPGAILYLPYAQGTISALGMSWRQAYLALPMIPAILLGAVAIWAAVRSRSHSK